jgi:thiol-disulfide isomerase/thioredoxin
MVDYNKKYIKYKKKYLNALKIYNQKIQNGGDNSISDQPKLIAFTAKWCGHCVNFMPLFNELKEEYSSKIKFINYDSEKNKDQIAKYNIEGYPTLYLEYDDKLIEYSNGPRSKENIIDFVEKYTNKKLLTTVPEA